MEREVAMRKVIVALASPMALISKPFREELLELCDIHDLTVKEVIEFRLKVSRDER